ncbi:MAG TPA: LysR family transcriptional regulator [Atopostipes sp.]|nr:LysR family transcriptional regulator [Atopostipes sp.]
MKLQDLIYFNHLAESLSFTETAEHFYVSQPSISTALKRLETELDTLLIDRRKTLKQIKLTPSGKLLYDNAKKALNILDATKQEIQDLEQETVYYGFLPTIGGYFLPKIMPNLKRYTSSIKFVEEESSDIMLDHIRNEKVPIAILGHTSPHIPDNKMKQLRIKEEEMALWVARDHRLAGRKVVDIEELRDEVFISLSEGYTHQRIFEQWARRSQIAEPNIVYAKEIKTVHSIASSTQMVAFMSDIIVGENDQLVRVPLKSAPKFYISLILNAEAEHSYIQQQFNEAVIDAVKEEFKILS